MSKEQRLEDLKKTLDNLLPEPIESDAIQICVVLNQFDENHC